MYPNYPNQGGPGYPTNPSFGFPQDPNMPSYPSYPGSTNPPYPGSIGFDQSQPSYPGAYPSSTGYPASQPNYPGQPGYNSGSSGLFDPYSGSAPQPGYLPPHIANNPNFQPTQPPQTHNLYPTQPNPMSFGQQPPTQPAFPGATNFGSGANYGATSQPNVQPYQPMTFTPTLRPHHPFNPNDDATRLYKAMKGIGTDETALIDVLCKRTYDQRLEISRAYKASYGKDLLKNILDETKGNFENVLRALLMSPYELEAHNLKQAIDGLGTNEDTVIDIICTKTTAEMQQLKAVYKQIFHKDLESEVSGDASGYFKRFLVSLIAAYRSDSPPDRQKAAQQARELYEAGEKKVGTNEVVFNRIFATESFPHLKAVFEEYQRITGHDLEKAIKSEMSGSVEKAFLAIGATARYAPSYWSNRLNEAMKGAGTHDTTLTRIIVLRSEKDMVEIKQDFQRRFGRTLESMVKADCSGDYERALRCLIGDPSWR